MEAYARGDIASRRQELEEERTHAEQEIEQLRAKHQEEEEKLEEALKQMEPYGVGVMGYAGNSLVIQPAAAPCKSVLYLQSGVRFQVVIISLRQLN